MCEFNPRRTKRIPTRFFATIRILNSYDTNYKTDIIWLYCYNFQELEQELREKPGKFYFVKVDLCSEKNILEAFEWVKSSLKTVHVLVNNAGVAKSSDLLGNNPSLYTILLSPIYVYNVCFFIPYTFVGYETLNE